MSLNRSLDLVGAEWRLAFPATLPAASDDWRADLEKAADVIVIPRADLPEVVEGADDGPAYSVGGEVFHAADLAGARRWALRHLALAECLDANPPVDEAEVQALAADLDEARRGAEGRADVLARRLVAAGWKR